VSHEQIRLRDVQLPEEGVEVGGGLQAVNGQAPLSLFPYPARSYVTTVATSARPGTIGFQ